jgi:hypothetical protein
MAERTPRKISQKTAHRAEGAIATTLVLAVLAGGYALSKSDKEGPSSVAKPKATATPATHSPAKAKPTPKPVSPESLFVPQKKELRLIANKAANVVLNGLDLPTSGTTKALETTGVTYIGNKAALIDPATKSTRLGERRPEMRAVYNPTTKEIEVLATGSTILASGPHVGREQFDSVTTIFNVGPNAKITNTSGELTTNDFRAAIADTKNVTLQGLDTSNNWGFDDKLKQEYGVSENIAITPTGTLIENTVLDEELTRQQPVGNTITDVFKLNSYVASLNAVAEAAEQGITRDLS